MSKKLYKVLEDDLTSPFQNFQYEIGKEYVCEDFDSNPENDCSNGFYATGLDGLPYSWVTGKSIFEVEVSGELVEIDEFKRRYEKIKILRECDIEGEIIPACKEIEDDLGYRLSEVIDPVHPLEIDPPEITNEHKKLLKKWDLVRDSVRDSVEDSVRDSVRDSVWGSVRGSVRDLVWGSVKGSVKDSVRDSVRDSVWDSVWGYIGSLFSCVDDWKGIDHEPGEYPFQPALDLWKKGLVPSYDGEVWRLHGGEDAEILFEMEVSDE